MGVGWVEGEGNGRREGSGNWDCKMRKDSF